MAESASGVGTRRGRRPGTSARALELAALRLFAEQGFEHTTVDQIAAACGVSRRSFFRYFDAKSDVLWHRFDAEIADLRVRLAATPAELPVLEAIRQAVVAANRYPAEDYAELRLRMELIGTVPALLARAAVHYESWERVVSEFIASRTRQPASSLYPLAAGRATLAVCRAAYDNWLAQPAGDPASYLSEALRALAAGFPDHLLAAGPAGEPGDR